MARWSWWVSWGVVAVVLAVGVWSMRAGDDVVAGWCFAMTGVSAGIVVTDWLALRSGARTTGVKLAPRRVARKLGMWSAWEQIDCPHPPHRERLISGDERNHGYRRQCMDCGFLTR